MLTSLIAGAGVGYITSKLNIKTEAVLSAGLVVGAVTGTLSLPLGIGILGACVVTGLKELLSNTATETIKKEETELERINKLFDQYESTDIITTITNTVINTVINTETETETETETKVSKEVKGTFISHLSTLITLAPVLILLNTIPGLSTLILPVSIITLCTTGYKSLTDNRVKTNIKNVLGLGIVGSIALYSLLNVASGGSLLYFLSLITIPSLLIKNKNINNNNKTNNSLFNIKNNFMYGNTGATLPVIGGAVALLQTIIMGSGQDMLGTLINNDYSILLDPYRLAILAGVIAITTIFGTSLLTKTKTLTTNNNFSLINKIVKGLTIAASIGVITASSNPIVGIAAVCAGITAKLLLKNNTNKIAIAVLLIIGTVTNI